MKAYVVTGLGYGDEGKGTVTHWLACRHSAHTVIRTGGAQALHRVVTANGQEHLFSQFGSGTLRGSATHLSKHMVIDPHGILREGESLLYTSGIRGVFDMMTIHEDALVITPFHAIIGRVRELMRGKGRLGSVGIGIGETVLDAEEFGAEAVRAKDLSKSSLREKLTAIQQRKCAEFEELSDRASLIPRDVESTVRSELAQLQSPDTVEWAVERFTELAKRVWIVNTEYVARKILGSEGTVVFEGSQGVLLDRLLGFHPYTTKVRTTPAMASEIMDECGYRGERKSLGVMRAYHTRHGGGPFVCESPAMTEKLQDVLNKSHPWQGNFRVGHFDGVAFRYAVEACGEKSLDGLVITCLDRIWKQRAWSVCDAYRTRNGTIDSKLFEYTGKLITGIRVPDSDGSQAQMHRQEEVGKSLVQFIPQSTTHDLWGYGKKDKWTDLCKSTLQSMVSVPIVAVSWGETERDKREVK